MAHKSALLLLPSNLLGSGLHRAPLKLTPVCASHARREQETISRVGRGHENVMYHPSLLSFAFSAMRSGVGCTGRLFSFPLCASTSNRRGHKSGKCGHGLRCRVRMWHAILTLLLVRTNLLVSGLRLPLCARRARRGTEVRFERLCTQHTRSPSPQPKTTAMRRPRRSGPRPFRVPAALGSVRNRSQRLCASAVATASACHLEATHGRTHSLPIIN